MSETDSESSGSPRQGFLVPIPTLAKLCTAVVLEVMRQMVWDTVEANLHEEAEIGVTNVGLMRLTCTDVRKAFSTKYNLDQVLQGSL